MNSTVIKIIGYPYKEPKINDDGSVEMLFRQNYPTEGDSKEIIIYVSIKSHIWETILPYLKDDSLFVINGIPNAKTTKKGVPFIHVVCSNAFIIKNTQKQLERQHTINNPTVHWSTTLDSHNFIDVPTDDILLLETCHTYGKMLDISELHKVSKTKIVTIPVAVKAIGNNKYSLVSGFKAFTLAKICNVRSLRAYVTDLSKENFDKKFNVIDFISYSNK